MKNTLKHFAVGCLVMLIVIAIETIVNLLPNTIFSIRWLAFILLAIYCVKWEINQENASHLQTIDYLRLRWLDILTDIIAALAGAGLVLWIC